MGSGAVAVKQWPMKFGWLFWVMPQLKIAVKQGL